MMYRTLGKSGIQVSPMGLGGWAMGGPFWAGDKKNGYGEVDDAESIRAIHRAFDLGINFFDTADIYGAGHSEYVLGKALKGRRDKAVIATKFGFTFDEETKSATGMNASAEYIRRACEDSLRRLKTDYIDLYQLHIGTLPPEEAEEAGEELERLVARGLIRVYGWSTDDPGCARIFARKPHCAAIQHDLNVLQDAPEILALCNEYDVASIARLPLAMGILSGKFNRDSRLPADDVRGAGFDWVKLFKDGKPVPELLDMIEAVRDVLTSGGRTLAQGALAWIWARSERTIPIPGFKSVKQVEENAGAMAFGPLKPEQMLEIDRLLGR